MKNRSPTSNPRAFLTIKEGAPMIGVQPKSLYRWIQNSPNPPPFKKVKGRYFLPRDEFTQWASQVVIE